MTSGNPAPASCPAWLSAWLLPSPVSWHSPSGTQNRESEEERASSAKPPKAQLWEKKKSINLSSLEEREGGRTGKLGQIQEYFEEANQARKLPQE